MTRPTTPFDWPGLFFALACVALVAMSVIHLWTPKGMIP